MYFTTPIVLLLVMRTLAPTTKPPFNLDAPLLGVPTRLTGVEEEERELAAEDGRELAAEDGRELAAEDGRDTGNPDRELVLEKEESGPD